MRCEAPEPVPTAPASVLAGEDCLRATEAYAQQRWSELQTQLADVAALAPGIERAYA